MSEWKRIVLKNAWWIDVANHIKHYDERGWKTEHVYTRDFGNTFQFELLLRKKNDE